MRARHCGQSSGRDIFRKLYPAVSVGGFDYSHDKMEIGIGVLGRN
jgi:hypothetical protein